MHRLKDLSKPRNTARHTRTQLDRDEAAISELLEGGHGYSIADTLIELREECCVPSCHLDNASGDTGFCWIHYKAMKKIRGL